MARLGCAGRFHGRGICGNVLIPETQPRKDVTGHVHRVGARRSHLAVGPRGRQPLGGERRVVAGMDDVMHDAGMIGVLHPKRRQHLHRAALRLETGIGLRFCRERRERVEGARIDVVRVCGVKLAHGRRVGIDAGLIVLRSGLVEAGEGGDVRTLACGLRRVGFGRRELAPARRHRCIVGSVPNLVKDAHGHSPVRHRTSAVGLKDPLELRPRLLVPEIVQQRDSSIEAGLCGSGTGDRKRYRAEVLLCRGCRRLETGRGDVARGP
jgi:hypothetical protein